MRFSFLLVCFLSGCVFAQDFNGTVLHKWVQMDFDWDGMGEDMNQWIAEGLFVAEHCILAGIKQWKNDIYVTIPRWAPGVPATLNIVTTKNGTPLLLPFPPVDQQMINTTQGLKNVQDIEIDPLGRMWILDTGALNFYFPDDYVYNTPRLFVYDITVYPPHKIQEYSFPEDIAQPGKVFLNDLVVDVINDYAFISNSIGMGGLYAYDYKSNTARLWVDESTEIENDGILFNIEDSGSYNVTTPSDGIALSVDTSTLYYCPLSGFNLYSIPTELFRNFSVSAEELHDSVTLHGQKNSQSDGIAIDSNGIMYFGDIGSNSVQKWDTSSPLTTTTQPVILHSNRVMQWQDTFAFGPGGYLVIVTNRLQLFPSSYDFTGNSGFNFHIINCYIGAGSYMEGALALANTQQIPNKF